MSTRAAEPAPRGLGENVPALDGIRGIAILLVLAHNLDVLDDVPGRFARALTLACDAGWIGVQLFFVLSGFLITGILVRTRTAPNFYAAFFARRILRIFPLYYAVLVAAFVVVPLVATTLPPELAHDVPHQIWLWTYLSNWASPFGAGSDAFPHFWSLAVEEQFYLLWPFVVRRLAPARLLRASLALAALALASRVALRIATDDPHGPYLFTVCRMDALGLGGATAVLLGDARVVAIVAQKRRALLAAAAALFFVGLVTTGAYARTSLGDQTYGYSILSLVFAAMVAIAVVDHGRGGRTALTRALSIAPLRAVGKVSYGMYVFHMVLHLFVGQRVLRALAPNGKPTDLGAALLYMLIATFATYALAWLSYRAFESRFLRMKERFVARARASQS